jgi:hypothetical protein
MTESDLDSAGPLSPKVFSNGGSINHHYIPRFYLKGFCRNDGKFDVFDKMHGKFKKAPQSPATVFFERGRNNVKYDGRTTDIIETQYGSLESPLSELFGLIRTGATAERILEPAGVRLLKFHLAIQFWRLPRFDAFADKYLQSLTIEQVEYLCTVTTPAMPAKEIYYRLRTDIGFRKYARAFLLPITTFDINRPIPDDMEWKIVDVEAGSNWANHLCTDAPFIFDDPQAFMHFTAPFIFPLTNARLLIATRRAHEFASIEPIVCTKISILSYLQAHRYVVVASKEYLEKVIDISVSYRSESGILQLQREVLSILGHK